MSTLLEINREIETALASMEEAQSNNHSYLEDVYMNELVALMDKEAAKIDSCIGFIRATEAQMQAIDEEQERLDKYRKSLDGRVTNLKNIVKYSMLTKNVTSLSGTMGRAFVLRDSQYVHVLNPDILPSKYIKTVVNEVPDKKLLGDDLKAGIDVPGAQMGIRQSIQLK